jgi:hypothetical protein
MEVTSITQIRQKAVSLNERQPDTLRARPLSLALFTVCPLFFTTPGILSPFCPPFSAALLRKQASLVALQLTLLPAARLPCDLGSSSLPRNKGNRRDSTALLYSSVDPLLRLCRGRQALYHLACAVYGPVHGGDGGEINHTHVTLRKLEWIWMQSECAARMEEGWSDERRIRSHTRQYAWTKLDLYAKWMRSKNGRGVTWWEENSITRTSTCANEIGFVYKVNVQQE